MHGCRPTYHEAPTAALSNDLLTCGVIFQATLQSKGFGPVAVRPWSWTTTAATGMPLAAVAAPAYSGRRGDDAVAAFNGVQCTLRLLQQHMQGAELIVDGFIDPIPHLSCLARQDQCTGFSMSYEHLTPHLAKQHDMYR